jgi:tRNA modification GTPase
MDPIVAPVTVLIPQPVGILRISGEKVWPFLAPFFPGVDSPPPARTATLLSFSVNGHCVDQVLLLYFPSPHSLTGEDVVEIHAHGNPHNVRFLLSQIQSRGIRLANPGEFSLRAYKNKKLSLLKAESLHRMISAPTYSEFLAAHTSFSNPKTHPLFEIKSLFLETLARLYSFLDHPEELDMPSYDATKEALIFAITSLLSKSSTQLSRFKKSRRFFPAYSILLAGAPNSGKSSLFNRLLRENKAIVSSLPGTTRDLLEGRISCPFGDIILLDSAGFRASNDLIEGMGIAKARQTISRVDLLLWIASPDHPNAFPLKTRTPTLTVWNKADLSPAPSSLKPDFSVSARTRRGLSSLITSLLARAEIFYSHSAGSDPLLDSSRQASSLSGFSKALSKALFFLSAGSFDLALSSLEEARLMLEDGMGMIPSEEIYDRVFTLFCLGK